MNCWCAPSWPAHSKAGTYTDAPSAHASHATCHAVKLNEAVRCGATERKENTGKWSLAHFEEEVIRCGLHGHGLERKAERKGPTRNECAPPQYYTRTHTHTHTTHTYTGSERTIDRQTCAHPCTGARAHGVMCASWGHIGIYIWKKKSARRWPKFERQNVHRCTPSKQKNMTRQHGMAEGVRSYHAPRVVRAIGKARSVRAQHLLNADCPMVVSFGGKRRLVIEMHPRKACLPMVRSVGGNSTETSASQP